jgi:hypothetical protein
MPDVAGSEPNDLQVTANTGAARLSVPIPVPLGTGGFAPELVLEYSSHAGDGPFGVGWQLRIPEIRRTARFGVPAWNDAVDRFELADELLVSAGGGRYHPQTETFQRVMRIGDTWEVTETDGTIARYGTGTGTCVTGPTGVCGRWLLSEIEDANGNQILFSWSTEGDVRGVYLKYVRWTYRGGQSTEGPMREVEFVYETRPDVLHAFPGGVETRMSKRVKEIVVQVGGNAFRRVVPKYSIPADGYATHRTRLASIQIFGSDCTAASGSGCDLPPENWST